MSPPPRSGSGPRPIPAIHLAHESRPHPVAPREYSPPCSDPGHPPLLCLHPYWTRWRKVWAVIGTAVLLAAGFLGMWSLKGAVSEMDGRWMPRALADSRWAGQGAEDKARDEHLRQLDLALLRLDVQLQGLDYDSKTSAGKLDALLLALGVPKPTPPPNPPPAPPPAPLPVAAPAVAPEP